MSNCWTEIVRHVSNEDRVPLTLRSSRDVPGGVELLTESTEAKEYWGKVSLTLSHEMADALGRALIAAAAEARDESV